MKRFSDIFFSALGLIILLPLFAVIAIMVKLFSPGPVFFTQKRIGKDLKPFNLYKFRTMTADAHLRGPSITAGRDPRVTNIGRILRKTKIDELPQLYNVLTGDMSLVGPRPEVEKYVSQYRDDYEEILRIRPGITDIASLKYKDEEAVLKNEPNPEEYYLHVLLPHKIKLAKEYVRNASFSYDLKLILLTIFSIIYPRESVLKLIHRITPFRRPIVIAIQAAIFVLSNYLAFYVRFEENIPPDEFSHFLKYLPILLFFRIIFLFAFSLDRGLWRYVSTRDVTRITVAVSTGSLLFFAVVRYIFGDVSYPRSVYILDWFINIFLLCSVRMFRRMHEKTGRQRTSKKRIIVIGAGDAAEMLLRDIEYSPFYPYEVIGLIDDNLKKKGLKIRNVPIMGTRKDLSTIVREEIPDEFLVDIPTASREEFREIVKDLRQYSLPIKTVPSMWSILSGRESLSAIKALEPEDILFRAPAYSGCIDLKNFFKGKRVLITGAGGSIGSELSRQIASYEPEKLILFERHEENLYKIDLELRSSDGRHSPVVSVIGDILDQRRIDEVMSEFRPQIVLHAAAYKHVPLMEINPSEAFKANVIGTQMLAEKAGIHGVERFVLISTDKAVNPANVMGMTKKIAEDIVKALSEADLSGTKYITVRFGNVLESSGSVVPLFTEQIKKGGPVTVTHPEIIRFFMTIPEAVSLVLQAAAIGDGGEVFVLDMGKPVKILDLAKRMISLHGYRPGVDIEISFIGLRPGEKLYEELFNREETIGKTCHAKINMAISERKVDPSILDMFKSPDRFRNVADIRNILARLTEK